ncbi:hypothetical protein A2801_00680 [Candidatus Woesebacteria bacterium RIFCSPHIGHO2_01_FULL_41_10]|uniref:Uncharacterized protein n=1 Tax=Candidatus Woesebacteria bacterium RIFCSPHIGHO2_01_FULL_41_10 TaxID=1802500 RepID=A0A1F7YP00_9BACT|nr:MAG: hypothetical protein A2801_00680 [Candidatus Woesebacteria bacterium RIFCSPHIGHO2_01_FULL_41_10]
MSYKTDEGVVRKMHRDASVYVAQALVSMGTSSANKFADFLLNSIIDSRCSDTPALYGVYFVTVIVEMGGDQYEYIVKFMYTNGAWGAIELTAIPSKAAIPITEERGFIIAS